MKLLKRKIDKFLVEGKNSADKKPLIVKGARQIGKTESIRDFAKNNYKSVIEINFVLPSICLSPSLAFFIVSSNSILFFFSFNAKSSKINFSNLSINVFAFFFVYLFSSSVL